MRTILAVFLFIASSGLIFAGFEADSPLPGIDYDIQASLQETCATPASSQDNRLLSYLSSGDSATALPVDAPGKSSDRLLRFLTCRFLDD